MNNKGFLTLEVILIIFILGIFTKNVFPIIYKSIQINNEIIIKDKETHIYENIIESIKISKKNSKNIGPYNINYIKLFENFKLHDFHSEILEVLIEEDHYMIKIEKENKNKFWKIKLQIKNIGKGNDYEEFVEFLLQK